MSTNSDSVHNNTHDSLLNELESIRSLLKEHSEDNQTRLSGSDLTIAPEIPTLNDAIPVLNDKIPLLDTIHHTSSITGTAETEAQLASMRAAAAMVAARAIRHRTPEVPPTLTKTTTPMTGRSSVAGAGDVEQLITNVMKELQPQLESLLRDTLRKHLIAQGNNPTGNP